MKQNTIIPIIIVFLLVVIGLLNIYLWYSNTISIYGLVYGVFSILLAGFLYHFKRKK